MRGNETTTFSADADMAFLNVAMARNHGACLAAIRLGAELRDSTPFTKHESRKGGPSV